MITEDAILEVSRVQREFDPALRPDLVQTDVVYLTKYVSGELLTFGEYPNSRSAMLASDECVWIPNGTGRWRSQDGRSLIEPGKICRKPAFGERGSL
jgi:hypothetical protein